jgi:LysM repeat protein
MAIAPLPDRELLDALTATRPPLRLLSFPGEGGRAADRVGEAPPIGAYRPQHRWSEARRARLRRSALVVLLVGLLGALAVPISGLAGTTPASLSAGTTYTVRPGDTLRSIAVRLDPANPKTMVGQLASETGSDTVVVGERIRLP